MNKDNFDELIKAIGERIRQIRKELKLSQREFGEAVGYSSGYISELETGKKEKKPSYLLFYKLSEIYNINIDFVFHGIGEMFNTGKPKSHLINVKKRVIGKELKSIDDLVWLMEISSTFYHAIMAMAGRIFFENEKLIRRLIEDDDTSNDALNDVE